MDDLPSSHVNCSYLYSIISVDFQALSCFEIKNCENFAQRYVICAYLYTQPQSLPSEIFFLCMLQDTQEKPISFNPPYLLSEPWRPLRGWSRVRGVSLSASSWWECSHLDEYSTIFSQIEAVLNSSPLCPLSGDPSESNYLSPGHFLCKPFLRRLR